MSTAVPGYTLQNGILRYHDKIVVSTTGNLRSQLIATIHASSVGGHSGIQATTQRAKLYFYWPGMAKEIENFIRECDICQ